MDEQARVTVCLRPDSVSFADIQDILWRANEQNRADGFVLRTSRMTPEELSARIGPEGCCFVALDGDRPVGTLSLRLRKLNRWYFRGTVPEYMLAGVLPAYQGKHVLSRLAEAAFAWAQEKGYPAMVLDTASNNAHAIAVYAHQGFRLVDFTAKKGLDHYSVDMIRFFGASPYPEWYRKTRYGLKKTYTRARFRVGGKRRI